MVITRSALDRYVPASARTVRRLYAAKRHDRLLLAAPLGDTHRCRTHWAPISASAEHMPSAHRRHRDWTHDRIRREAARLAPPPQRESFRTRDRKQGLVVGRARARILDPIVAGIRAHVFAADKIYGDDTPVPVLAPGTGKTKTGRLWVYARDDRPFCGTATRPTP
jgi:hypothetical protein